MTSRNIGRRGVVATLGRNTMVAGVAATLAAVLLLAMPAAAASFQFNVTVRGKVTDADGNPLEGVTVTVRKVEQDPSRPFAPIETRTDEDGNYNARNVPIGFTSITFELEGYDFLEEEREFRRAGPQRIDVTLEKTAPPEEYVRAQVANEAYGAGADAFNAGDYPEAIARMNEALEALDDTPENAEARGYVFALLGASYLRQRMYDEAVDAFRTRLGYQPQESAAHFELAQALAESGDEAAAADYYASALELEPGDAMTQYNVGVTMVNSGSVEEGIARIEKAVELQPVYPLAYKNLGYAYSRIEQYQKAIDAFEKYLEQAPDAEDVAEIRDFVALLKDMIG